MLKKYYVLILCLGCFVFECRTLAQEITFESFVKKFPVANLPFKIDRKMIDKSFVGLKQLTPTEIKLFLLQKQTDTIPAPIETNLQDVLRNKIQFFVVNKLNIYDDFTSLVVYRFDKTIAKGYGILSYDFLLFNFDKKNTLLNIIILAKEEYFMSARFHQGFLEKNNAGEVILKDTETDYSEYSKAKQKKSNYEIHSYHLLSKKMTLQNINERYFPYAGTFSQGNDEIVVDQNNEFFSILRGAKDSGGYRGEDVLTFDLQKGTFTLKTEDMGVVQGEFNADKTEIKITKPDKKVLVYVKTGKW